MAFYQAVLHEACGEDVPVYLIAVEKKEPFRCGCWRVLPETLEKARAENIAAMNRLMISRDSGVWPTGYEEMRYLSID